MGVAARSKKIIDLRREASTLPLEPGVYIYRDAEDAVLYVGKSASLRKRVRSYFQRLDALAPRIRQMVRKIERMEIRRTATEGEALLLEAELIKAFEPPYNILFRDDKRYPLLKITRESFPRLMKARKRNPDGARYFGPYVTVGLLNEALQFMRTVFPLRTCYRFPESPCLEYHLGQCLAPCVGFIDRRGYERIVSDLVAFLEGKKNALLKDLKRRMEQASKRKAYEEAARLRDQIEALTSVIVARERSQDRGPLEQMQRAFRLTQLPRRIEAFDISHSFGSFTVASMVVFQNAKPLKSHYRRFRIETVPGIDDFACMREVITRRYSGSLASKLPFPDLILIDGGKGQLSAGLGALKTLKLKMNVIGLAKRFEHVILADTDEPIVLLQQSPVLQLVQQVRDEAHRVAITYHRRLRGSTVERSVLETIPGIGKKRALALLKAFGGLGGIASASTDALCEAARMSQKLARDVKQAAKGLKAPG